MQGDVTMNQARGSPWAWFGLAVLMAFTVSWTMSYELRIVARLYLFLPLLAGWLAIRFGLVVLWLMLAVAPVSVFTLSWRLFDTLSISIHIPLWVYILAVLTAVAFARPRDTLGSAHIFTARWRWLRWLLPVALWLAVFKYRDFLWSVSDTLRIGFNPGFVLLLVVLAASIKWPAVCMWGQARFSLRDKSLRTALIAAAIALLVLGFLLYLRWNVSDQVSMRAGFISAYGLVSVLAFLLVAFAILDWRLTVILLAVFFASEIAVSWLGETFGALLSGEPGMSNGAAEGANASGTVPLSYAYFEWRSFIQATAAVLLGAAMAPFWRDQNPVSLCTRRTRAFLFLALLVLCFGMPGYYSSIGSTGLMLVGGAAYIMGIIWQMRGIVAGPLLIQMLYLLGLAVRCADHGCGADAYELINIAFVAFVFAFFGLLSNRYRAFNLGPSMHSTVKRQP